MGLVSLGFGDLDVLCLPSRCCMNELRRTTESREEYRGTALNKQRSDESSSARCVRYFCLSPMSGQSVGSLVSILLMRRRNQSSRAAEKLITHNSAQPKYLDPAVIGNKVDT